MNRVWTAQFRYSGADRYDITVKSGDLVFAPSWSMVLGLKDRRITEDTYQWQYNNLMAKSQKLNPQAWNKMTDRDEVTLVCYCPAGAFCHRVLLARMLVDLGMEYMGERT